MPGGLRLEEIVARLEGVLQGDGAVVVSQVGTLLSAGAGQIRFLANLKFGHNIGDGAERDDQIQIGHNGSIGDQAAVAGCVGVAGSTRMDRRCAAGATGMIIGYLELGDDVHISAGIMVTRSLPRIGQ
ncbi:MAG: hypothetical protein J0M13_09370 [Candidatus Accumulibacter sp.]|nr:hypothetical protein [Candidatus Accumulibacter necessarius]